MRRDRRLGQLALLATAGALLFGLPLAGVANSGRAISQFTEFPPLTRYVQHAPFSWTGFAVILAVDAPILAVLLWVTVGALRRGKTREAEARSGAFPAWGWAGVAIGCSVWVLAWTRFPWLAPLQRHTFTPLWLSYILVVNALCVKRSSRCLLLEHPLPFGLLFFASAGFWWFFEYLNRFVQNWYYLGVETFGPAQYVLFASISFSTVLPAVLSTCDLLLTVPGMDLGLRGRRPIGFGCHRPAAGLVLVGAAVGLALIGLAPDVLFPLLWVSPLLIVVSLQVLLGQGTVFSGLARGDWRAVVIPAWAALLCGWFWEMWNIGSLAKWVYSVPYVNRFAVFEMPVLGYAGYLPFGLECLVIGALVLGPGRWPCAPDTAPGGRPAVEES